MHSYDIPTFLHFSPGLGAIYQTKIGNDSVKYIELNQARYLSLILAAWTFMWSTGYSRKKFKQGVGWRYIYFFEKAPWNL